MRRNRGPFKAKAIERTPRRTPRTFEAARKRATYATFAGSRAVAVLVCRTRSSPPPRHGKACADIRPKSWRCKTKTKKRCSAPRGHGRKKRPGGESTKQLPRIRRWWRWKRMLSTLITACTRANKPLGMHMHETGEKEHSDPNPGG